MANGDTSRSTNGMLYGIIGALCVVVAGGGFYLFKADKPVDAPIQGAKPMPPVPPPLPVATPRPAPPPAPPAPTGLSASQINQARNLIADARRFASLGSFADAETALQNADKTAPGFAEVAQARRDISEMRTTRGQLGPLVDQARRAIERGDFATAERALNEAEQIDPNAPAVIEARRELRVAERRGDQPQDTRVTFLVATARAAILVGDFASADRMLNQAEQIDLRDSAVVQARAEFYTAQRSGRPQRN